MGIDLAAFSAVVPALAPDLPFDIGSPFGWGDLVAQRAGFRGPSHRGDQLAAGAFWYG